MINKVPDIAENDTEVKKEIAVYARTIDKLTEYCSDWTKLRQAVAWMMGFKTYCRHCFLKHSAACTEGKMSLKELR